jgi:hypothetical protein
VPETLGVGEAVVGEVAVQVVRCGVIVPTGRLIHPIFGGGGRLTGSQISWSSETVRERKSSIMGNLAQR